MPPAPPSSITSRKSSASRPSSTNTPTSPRKNAAAIEQILPKEALLGFRGAYLETAQRLKAQQGNRRQRPAAPDDVDQLDFEFVLFASAVIDYDYIMGLIAKFSAKGPGKSKMSREELIGLIQSDAKFMNERDGHRRIHRHAQGRRGPQ